MPAWPLTCMAMDRFASTATALGVPAASPRFPVINRPADAGRYPFTGSCAEVWSVTASGRMPRLNHFREDAQPRYPTDRQTMLHGHCRIASFKNGPCASFRVAAFLIEVAGTQPEVDPALLAFNHALSRRRPWWPQAVVLHPFLRGPGSSVSIFPLRSPPIVLPPHFHECLVRALDNSLAGDVDPGPGRHLSEHHQALAIEFIEVLPVGPGRHQVGVGDQHPRRIGRGS